MARYMIANNQLIPMKSLLLFSLLLLSFAPYAQQAGNRENAGFWAEKGNGQMGAGQYAEAYTAFQLARSLGAPDMAAKMELAKKRNINSIQFRALLAEARGQAATDPTQSLRLLEYAHQKFPDSTVVLTIMGEVANQPHNWYYALRADGIIASPKFNYLVTRTDKTRLYQRQGDSLTLIQTFADETTLIVFSPDDRYLLVTLGTSVHGSRYGNLYALNGPKIRLMRRFNEAIVQVRFSPNIHPEYGAWMVLKTAKATTTQLQLMNLVNLDQSSVFQVDTHGNSLGDFSPTGRFLLLPGVMLALNPTGFVPSRLLDGVKAKSPFFSYECSPDDRHLRVTNAVTLVGTNEDGLEGQQARLYTIPPPGDTLRPTIPLNAQIGLPRRLWAPFSPNGQYAYANQDPVGRQLHYFDGTTWKPVICRDTTRYPDADTLTYSYETFRFLSNNVLLSWESRGGVGTSNAPGFPMHKLWRLDSSRAQVAVYGFGQEGSLDEDVFSPDGRYVLTRQSKTSTLWRIDPDTVVLVHRFAKALRKVDSYDENGWPVGGNWFSPKGQYLLAYADAAPEVDSLWQITPTGLLPMHGFGNRLREERTLFSPDERLLRTETTSPQPAMLWVIPAQIPLVSPLLTEITEALFAPQGQVLLTKRQIGPKKTDVINTIWRITDQALLPGATLTRLAQFSYCTFSPDGRFLMASVGEPQRSLTSLYRVHPDHLAVVHRYYPKRLTFFAEEGRTYFPTYQTGLFSPNGNQWLEAQTMGGRDRLWSLSDTAQMRRPQNAVDRYITNTNWGSIYPQWHPRPAALFSPDSRFLMAREREALRCYELTPRGQSYTLGATPGWPIDVSANGQYWLTLEAPMPKYAVKDSVDFTTPVSMDTLRLWRRTETPQGHSVWNRLNWLSPRYDGRNTALNTAWQGSRQQSLFSPAGNYLLLTTVPTYDVEGMTTLFRVEGNTLRPVANLNTRAYTAAHIVPSPANGWEAGLIYSGNQQQTYLLRHGSAGTRTTSLGFGTLALPPRFTGKMAWWVRKKDDSQQNVELLDLVTTKTMVQVPFGSVLDMAVRPNGNVWVISTTGARLIRSPGEVLRWLKQAPVAPLHAGLRQVFGFL